MACFMISRAMPLNRQGEMAPARAGGESVRSSSAYPAARDVDGGHGITPSGTCQTQPQTC